MKKNPHQINQSPYQIKAVYIDYRVIKSKVNKLPQLPS